MPPFSINPPQPLDFRYPGAFNLNQTAKLPSSFGPPDMSQQFQSGLSALADPIVAGMKEAQNRAEAGKIAAEGLAALNKIHTQQGAGGMTMPGSTTSSGPVASATTGSPAGDDTTGAMGGGKLAATNPQVRDTFMNTVKTGGLNNPYGLAAVAAYGQRESGWSSGNINRTWDDLGKPSGGALSWRAERLRNMQRFVQGAEDPVAAQAMFFLKEDPQLIARLNEAKSSEEANRLMADAWRFKGYNERDGGEYQARLNLTRAYVARMGTAAPAPQAAPTASFAPQVAPAPTPAAAASVTAPAAPQQAPQFTAPNVNMNDYATAIGAALKRGDKDTAEMLAQERDQVLAQQQGAQPQQQAAPQPAAPPQQPQAQGAAPGPQSQQQSPQEQQQAQQQQILQTVGQTTDTNEERLEAQRQAGQRMRLASISPQLPGLQLGTTMPGAQGAPAAAPAAPPPAAPPPPPPAMAEPSFFSPQPMLPPQDYAARPPTPAPSPAVSAPAPPAGPVGPPPQQPAGVPPPYQVAQSQGLPPVVTNPQRGSYNPELAAVLLKNARTPEEANRILAGLYQQLQPPAAAADRFQVVHDANGNWVRVDRLTGQVTPMSGAAGKGSTKGADTVEIETPRGKQRMQWNPATGQYDIPVGGPPATGPVPVSKEIREAERQLFNDFESTETVKKYRELEQGVQGLKAAFTGGSASADLIAVIQLFKAIDPGSTVTATEGASIRNAAGVPETLRALFNKGVGEGGQFSPALRAEIFNTAQRLQQGRVQQVEKHAQSYRNRAKAYDLNPDRVVAFDPFKFEKAKPEDFPDISRREEGGAAPGAAIAPGSSRQNPIDVPNLGAAERMPPGTYFRLNGRIGVIE